MIDGREVVVSFSGGRSSAYMLYLTLQEGIHDHVLFFNTGKEKEQTLRFVQDCSVNWEVNITWLEYNYAVGAKGGSKDPLHTYNIVDFNTASRKGEPFLKLIRAKKFLPNALMRFCTQELKVNTGKRYLQKECGLKHNQYVEFLGIRYDEPKRWQKVMADDRCNIFYPLVPLKITALDVRKFWEKNSFDLALPYNAQMGNCDLCFLKGRQNLVRLIREKPSLTDWWIDREEEIGGTFRKQYSYVDLKKSALAQMPLFEFDDETEIDCFCELD